jgi:hypothetical protein
MHDDPLIEIKCINKMSKHIGKDVAKNMNIPLDELKQYIKPKEIKSIILQYSIVKNGKALINAFILQKVFREVNNWILGIQLSKMAAKGELEALWDDEQNCMVFSSK